MVIPDQLSESQNAEHDLTSSEVTTVWRYRNSIIMRPSTLGGGRIMRRTLSVCLSVCPSVCLSVRPVIVTERHVTPPSELQWHTCTFRHALRAAYRTAISAAQILVIIIIIIRRCLLMSTKVKATQ